jgi:hypothetical protein
MKLFYLAKRKLQLVPAAIILIALAASTQICAQSITTIDAPGAGTGPFQGTSTLDIRVSWRRRSQPNLKQVVKLPFALTHGDLKLNPVWDDLRDDPLFDRILAESALPFSTNG